MTYPPQQPDNWSDPSWPSQAPGFDPKTPYDPAAAAAAAPVSGQAGPYGDPSAIPVGQQPGYPAGYAAPGYPAGYAAPGYPAGYAYPVAAQAPTNGLAIAGMIVSIVGAVGLCMYGLGGYLGIVGAIMGHVARKQIRERGEQGGGMATAGIIVGWIATAIAIIATVLIVIFVVWAANQDTTYDGTTY